MKIARGTVSNRRSNGVPDCIEVNSLDGFEHGEKVVVLSTKNHTEWFNYTAMLLEMARDLSEGYPWRELGIDMQTVEAAANELGFEARTSE